MNHAGFWQLVQRTLSEAALCEDQAELITEELVRRGLAEAESFSNIFDEFMDESYRADLWDIYFIVNGGASDDAFEYFRAWLISRGEKLFRSVIAEPRILPSILHSNDYGLDEDTWECEAMLYCAINAYHAITGEADEYPSGREVPAVLRGKLTPESELPQRYPEVWRECEERDGMNFGSS